MPTLETAMQEIQSIMSQINAMGANDYEMSALQQLLTQLASGVITPAAAITAARNIRDSKQAYH